MTFNKLQLILFNIFCISQHLLCAYGRPTANSTETQLGQVAPPAPCPLLMAESVIPIIASVMSRMEYFQNTELPPLLIPRVPGTAGSAQVRERIKARLGELEWTVEEDVSVQFTPFGPVQFVNIIGTQNPAAKKRIVLACHYDSKLFPPGFVGAIDSAVPCAMLLDLAQQLTLILRFLISDTTIQLIFFDGEEAFFIWTPTDSLYGSRNLARVWANSLDKNDPTKNNLANIQMFILLDLIGHPSTAFQRFYPESDVYFSQLILTEKCLRDRGLLTRDPLLPLLFQDKRRTTNIQDDHMPFQEQGVRIMHLITSPFPPTWHTLYDNALSLDYKVIDDLGRILRLFVTNVATNALITDTIEDLG